MRIVLLFIIVFTVPTLIHAATIYVPQDYPTIQGAVDAARDDDTIIVDSGVYKENVFVSKDLTLKAKLYAIIDGHQRGSCISFIGCNSVLDGFSIKNGSGTPVGGDTCGGGVYCYDSTVQIKNNLIYSNSAYCGGGVHIEFSGNEPGQCDIRENAINANKAITIVKNIIIPLSLFNESAVIPNAITKNAMPMINKINTPSTIPITMACIADKVPKPFEKILKVSLNESSKEIISFLFSSMLFLLIIYITIY